MLHRRGCRVCVVEVNPLSFALARTFFWMPGGIECIATDMREFLAASRRTFDAIGIDVGGPHFSYEDVLDPRTIARVKRALRAGGRVAVNISCEAPDDPVPGRIAARFKAEGLDVWAFTESAERSNEVNAVILASARQEAPSALQQVFQHAGIAQDDWCLARLAG
jgi:spermidine synthase